jgi:hypothetical protein
VDQLENSFLRNKSSNDGSQMNLPHEIVVGTIVGFGSERSGCPSQSLTMTGCIVRLGDGRELPLEFDRTVDIPNPFLLFGRQVVLAIGTNLEPIRIVRFADDQ